MKPGRKLDVLIAEKVMGFEKVSGYSSLTLFKNTKGLTWIAPPYSTDIADAWTVVEKLTGPKMSVSLSPLWEIGKNEFKWIAKVEFWGSERFEFSIEETAPHAICIAALKALGVDIPTT